MGRLTDVDALVTFAAIDAAWSANLEQDPAAPDYGRPRSLVLARRLAARERALAIQLLGMASEDGTAANRYASTTGELVRAAKALSGMSGKP